MNCSSFAILLISALCAVNIAHSKIILPHKLRYLENMLNSDVMAKAKKIRQRIEANPNIQENEKDWPLLLAKYQEEESKGMSKRVPSYTFAGLYNRRYPGA